MNQDYRRIFRGLHYQEKTKSQKGEVYPEGELHEVTVERSDGGTETFQSKETILLGCGHKESIDQICKCALGNPVCKNCLCKNCKRGLCLDCQAVDLEGGEKLCIDCFNKIQDSDYNSGIKNIFSTFLSSIGLIQSSKKEDE